MWKYLQMEKYCCSGTVLLFNYADRDPLTNNAHVTDVTKDVFENLNRD